MRKYIQILGIVLLFVGSVNTACGQVVTKPQKANETVKLKFKKKESAPIVKAKLHSPSKAAIYEALVPGLGHIYNKKIWHLPIVYAVFGSAIYLVKDNSQKYHKYRDAYADFSVYMNYLNQDPQYPMPLPEPTAQSFRKIRDFDFASFSENQLKSFKQALQNNKNAFRRYRDLSYIYLAVSYVLNIVWATTDAHFFDYDISDDLSFHIRPKVLPVNNEMQGMGVNFVVNF